MADGQTGGVETPSGKGAGDENFPVGSILISPRLRPHVACFYAFARAADDIADNPDLTPEDKIARLDAFEAGLDGDGPQKAVALGESLRAAGVVDAHARDLLAAFRQDAVKTRYCDWDDLLGYCALSANPVGRFLLDLHGEDPAGRDASDALCTVLQILNHLQDAAEDFARMDRVYVPQAWLAAEGLEVGVLNSPASPPGYRRVVDRMLDGCDRLLAQAQTLPGQLRSRRLAAESRTIVSLACRLSRRLRREDPLAGRVRLGKLDFAIAGLGGVAAFARVWR